MVSKYLYLILNLGSLSIPLLYSFLEKRFHFIKYFKVSLFSILIIAFPFLVWDVIFTMANVWGFNTNYHLSIFIFGMPIEEWLFFFCIPYACLFTHEVLKYYLPNLILSKFVTKSIVLFATIFILSLLVTNLGKWYTTVNFVLFSALMIYSWFYQIDELRKYFVSFGVILIPFLIVNGILTGSFIESPVVWYNNEENLNTRFFTIPVEDFFYAFNLLFSIQIVFNRLKKKLC